MDKKSPDAFRTISEVAEWLGVPTHVLRFWESRFTQVKPVKRAGGRRYYRPTDMELLGGIRKLLHEDGMTIRGVQKLLREHGAKHVAAMSPPIDSDQSPEDIADQAGSNVVSFEAGRDTAPAESASPADAGVDATPTTPEDPPPDHGAEPETASTTPAVQNAPVSDAPLSASGPATDQAPVDNASVDNAPLGDAPAGAAPVDAGPQTEETGPDTSNAQAPGTVPEAPMAFPSSDTFAEDHPPADIVDMPPAPQDKISPEATEPKEVREDAPADPLEPVPHDGPTIAETLSAHDTGATSSPIDTNGLDETAGEEDLSGDDTRLPEASGTDPEHTPTGSGDDTGMDLFAFADTVPAATDRAAAPDAPAESPADPPSPAAPAEDIPTQDSEMADDAGLEDTGSDADDLITTDDKTPSDAPPPVAESMEQAADIAPEDEISDAGIADAPQKGMPEETAQSVTPDTGSDAPATSLSDLGDTAPVKDEGTAETAAAAQQLGDISHIPADPADEDSTLTTTPLTSALRMARKTGTEAHLPVLQALADRLDALSGQMNRSGRG